MWLGSGLRCLQGGVALVMVLWMIVVMMTMAATLLYSVRTETQMSSFARLSAETRAVADAAVHYTVLQLFMPPDQRTVVLGGGASHWDYAGYKTEIRIAGENGLIDINRADRNLLQTILDQSGVNIEEGEAILDVIEDFRDPDDLRRLNGAEDADYEREGLLQGAKDAPFERIEELQQVLGMTPALYKAFARYLSVNSRSRGVNPMLAPRHVLLLLAEGDAAIVDEYIQQREASEGAWVQPSFGQGFIDRTEQPAYRIQVKVQSEGNKDVKFLEERGVRLLPGRVPPFMTYFKGRQALSEQFQ